MTRWIEKDGTGIEKSGTGIEKSGTGIEKSGTGIEKSGTGIEKSGTGLHRAFLACAMTAIAFSANAGSQSVAPEGLLQVAANGSSVKVSWIFDNSVFSGVSQQNGSYASMVLTEVALFDQSSSALDTVGQGTGAKADTVGQGTGAKADTVGQGTGAKADTVGQGTGSKIETVGQGTGSKIETVGQGTGISLETVGQGTGISIETVGQGTGISIETVGQGTGSAVNTVGQGTGASTNGGSGSSNTVVLTVGQGTGAEAIAVTLPGDGGMHMEISLGCSTATVYVLDAQGYEVVAFENVAVAGNTGLCSGPGAGYGDPSEPGKRRHVSNF